MSELDRGYLARRFDRPMRRPAGVVYWLDDEPPRGTAWALALQHIAIQSVYFLIPAVLADVLSSDPGEATRYLCLSVLAAALWQALMLLTRGPVGAGYPVPATQSAALLGAYGLVAASGASFGAAGAMLLVVGAVAVALTFLMQRLSALMPNEVTGVVVLLIGISLVVLATRRLGLQPGGHPPDVSAVAVVVGCLMVMVFFAVSRTRAAPFAVLAGALVGIPLALVLGHGPTGAADTLARQPWVALPHPFVPRFDQITAGPMMAFLVALVALKAAAVGSLVVLQRNLDGNWSRPDAPPLRRGLLANGLATMAGGLLGAACPAPATAAMGLSIATGTLARRIVWIGVGLLALIALCPKLLALFVLVPEPVKAAILFYVAGLVMVQGCQLVNARLLDARRTLIVGFGLGTGIAAAVAPQAFLSSVPALSSPLSIGAMVAFLINLLTLPFVSKRSTLALDLGDDASRRVGDWFAGLAGAWALKPVTARAVEQCLGELVELLHERGSPAVSLQARRAEDRVELQLTWAGEELPRPPEIAHAEDLMGSDETRHRFVVWLATRQAQAFRQRRVDDGHEAWLAFED